MATLCGDFLIYFLSLFLLNNLIIWPGNTDQYRRVIIPVVRNMYHSVSINPPSSSTDLKIRSYIIRISTAEFINYNYFFKIISIYSLNNL